MTRRHRLRLFAASAAVGIPTFAYAQQVPACRLDASAQTVVADTVARAAQAYKVLGAALPFDSVAVNPSGKPGGRTLSVYVIQDASQGDLTAAGCPRGPAKKDEPLDALSVRGGCVVSAVDNREVRCSASAVALFGNIGNKVGRANPALLYVLSHELAHLHQRRMGEYSGRAERINLATPRAAKLQALQDACDPVSTKREEEADALAMGVLKRLLPHPPYQEPLFSQQGSLLWNIDQLALASDAWVQASLEREFISRPRLHKAFVPTEFPTPKRTVEANAKQFVCDVLTKSSGSVLYPGKSTSHPPIEQRLRRIAEALEPIARTLPNDAGRRQFEAVARLQSQVSPILTHIYRETGAYLEGVQSSICTVANAPDQARCK
jgi:hypothetical protein